VGSGTEMPFKFVELNVSEDTSILVEALQPLMPESSQILNLIELFKQKLYEPAHIPVFKFYSFELVERNDIKCINVLSRPDWKSSKNPLFIAVDIKTQYDLDGDLPLFSFHFMFSRETPSPQEDDNLVKEFSTLFDWDGTSIVEFGAVSARLIPFVETVGKLNGRSIQSSGNSTMFLPLAKALEFGNLIPKPNEQWSISKSDGENLKVCLKPLNPRDAEVLNSHWKFGTEGPNGTILLMTDQIRTSISTGAYLVNENGEEGDLVSWTISLPSATINNLHTTTNFRRMGLAELVMKFQCYHLALKGVYPITEIEYENPYSKKLMEKLGFELAFEAAWMQCILPK